MHKLANGRIRLSLESSSEFYPKFYSFELLKLHFFFWFLVPPYHCYLGTNLCLPRLWYFYPRINYPRWSALLCFPSKQSGQEIWASWGSWLSALIWGFAFYRRIYLISTFLIYNWLNICIFWFRSNYIFSFSIWNLVLTFSLLFPQVSFVESSCSISFELVHPFCWAAPCSE